jgi:outer membrane immunogenic protein
MLTVGAKMKRSFFGIAAIAAIFATPVLAADIPLKAPPIPLFVWTGFYGGVNTGYSWGNSLNTTDVTALATTYNYGVTHRGWEASVEGGYCWQQAPTTAFVACLEARYDFPRERSASTTIATILPGATQTTVTARTHVDPILIGPHLGFLTNANRTMWYGAGGVAIGQVGGSATGTNLVGASTANPSSTWATGWFVGAGVEQMLTNNWGLKIEYDYVNFNTGGVTATYAGTNLTLNPIGAVSPATATLAGHPFDNVVTVGINYHLH